jgi:carboxypeptidase C (cathepsin A)
MLKSIRAPHIVAVAVLMGNLACVSPAHAADMSSAHSTKAGTTAHAKHHKMMSPEEMKDRVEDRITSMHTKLKITPEQEAEWNNVAQAMRDSESSISDMIKERHENAETMTAVQDLQSYQKISLAHADGLQKVIDTFSKLYDDMSDEQKATADTVFGNFEGHGHGRMKQAEQ